MPEQKQSKFGGIPVGTSKFGGIPVGSSFMAAKPEQSTFADRLQGSEEAALTFATGIPSQVMAGLGGVTELVSGLISGAPNVVDSAANRVRDISRATTYQPKTEEGQQILEMISVPFEKFGELTAGAGNIALDITGSPAVATAVKTGIEMPPAFLFGRSPRTMAERRGDIAKVETGLKGVGIDLGKSIESQRAQMGEIARRLSNYQEIRAQEMATVQQAVQRAEQIASENVNNLYAAARETPAFVPVRALYDLPARIREALKDYMNDLDLMPIARNRLKELDEISQIPGNYAVKLEELENFRRRVNRVRPAAHDLSQQAVLGIIKGQLDSTLDAAFNSGMIKGDPAAIQAWRDARGAFIDYKKTFDEQKVINQLAFQKATPEEVRNWIFGTSALGAKKGAGRVIESLKRIVGEDSPAFGALRQEAVFDIMEPLLRETPDYAAYVENFDKFVRNNASVARALFPDSISEMQRLRAYASAANRVRPQQLTLDANQTIARALFGHGIAKAGMKVSIASQLLGLMRQATGKTERAQILSEILGYDVTQPLIPVAPIGASGVIQTGMNQGNQ